MRTVRRSPSAVVRAARSPVSTPLPLPHERDESTSADVRVDAATAQAARDVTSGKVDTDTYPRSRETNARNPAARVRSKKAP